MSYKQLKPKNLSTSVITGKLTARNDHKQQPVLHYTSCLPFAPHSLILLLLYSSSMLRMWLNKSILVHSKGQLTRQHQELVDDAYLSLNTTCYHINRLSYNSVHSCIGWFHWLLSLLAAIKQLSELYNLNCYFQV